MMQKTLLLLSLVFLTFVSISAQTSSALEVSNPQYVYNVNKKYNVGTSSNINDRASVSLETLQEVSAVFHNTGAKTIKKVSWQFISYQYATRTKIKDIFNLKSDTEITAGNSLRLSKIGVFWGNNFLYLDAKVYRIEYSDGSVWEVAKIKD